MENPASKLFVDVIISMHDLIDKCKEDEEFKEITEEFREFVSRLACYFYRKTGSKMFINGDYDAGNDR